MVKRKKRGGRKARLVVVPFNAQLTLATLADDAVISGALMANFGEDFFCISIDAAWGIRGHTAGETPLRFGFAHGDYSDTEIAEAINAEITDPDDKIAQERSRRLVRTVGSFDGSLADPVYNDGRVKRTPIRWSIGDGHQMDFWLINESATTNLTTGSIVECQGKMYGRWQR